MLLSIIDLVIVFRPFNFVSLKLTAVLGFQNLLSSAFGVHHDLSSYSESITCSPLVSSIVYVHPVSVFRFGADNLHAFLLYLIDFIFVYPIVLRLGTK